MLFLTCLCFLPGQIDTKESTDFPRKLQVQAIMATVRIGDPAHRNRGSGVIIGRKDPFVYILTAHHVIKDMDALEITTFSEKSYPKADKIHRGGRVVAKTDDVRDLALIRMVAEDLATSELQLCPLKAIPAASGFAALSVGCSLGDAPTPLLNQVAGRKKVSYKAGGERAYYWELNENVTQGRSGGPLVDQRGYLVGICSGTNNGKGFYCHPEEIHRFLRQNVFDWLVE